MNNHLLQNLQKKNVLKKAAANLPHQHHYLIENKKTLTELFSPLPIPCHKWAFGHVLIIEGNSQFSGAARLSALAALKVGAGLVTIATKDSTLPNPFDRPEFMRIKIDEINDAFLQKIDVLVIGPGLSKSHDWQEMALDFLNQISHYIPNIICDADALPLLLRTDLKISNKTIIATPHIFEACGLLNINNKITEYNHQNIIEKLALLSCNKNNQITWLLKGENSIIRHHDNSIFIFTGQIPLLSAGGMGDVLSGAIAGLIKQTDCALCGTLLAQSMQIEAAHHLAQSNFKGILASEFAMCLSKYTMRL
jgi:hydroxyethylthiazole kinase-like uncharacterized protein yjeF